jgi:hypothetical protein
MQLNLPFDPIETQLMKKHPANNLLYSGTHIRQLKNEDAVELMLKDSIALIPDEQLEESREDDDGSEFSNHNEARSEE